MSLTPILKNTGQESGDELCGNFQILIFPAVKMCKQCLQTASTLPVDPTGPQAS